MTLLLALAWLAAHCGAARAAGGADITWADSCWADVPQSTRGFACDRNDDASVVTVSFQLDQDQPHFAGLAVLVDFQADASALPDWWQVYNIGACRRFGLTADAVFTSPGGCPDPWRGRVSGGIGAYQTSTSFPPVPNGLAYAARLKVFLVRDADTSLVAGVSYRGCRLTLLHANTVGAGACAGCATGVTLVLNQVNAEQSVGGQQMLTGPTPGGNQCLIWNASTISCDVVPARSVTWGRVKSMYR